ncbi:MAG: nucleoside hydrolase [Chloroflexota bacterium]
MSNLKMSESTRLHCLQPPQGKVRMVLDTDTYNEIDDQFAVVQALLSPEQLSVEAIYAAPFANDRAATPAEGMAQSYDEILRLLDRLGVSSEGLVYRGSTDYLADLETPQQSDAVQDLVERAMGSDETLYVVAIAAITNIASAILLEPRILDKIVVVWLGGHALHWPHTREFNLKQDVLGAQVLFDSGVPLVLLPCAGVTTHLRSTVPEIERYVQGQGAIGDYLAETFKSYSDDHFGWSKEIWDMIAVAYLINPDWVPTQLVHSPIVTDQVTWSFDSSRHLIRYASYVERDPIFRDFFMKLAAFAATPGDSK